VRLVWKESKIGIWKWAKSNGFSIVTFDSDFVDLSLVFGFPPKVIWLRLGNSSTERIAKTLLEKKDEMPMRKKLSQGRRSFRAFHVANENQIINT
jgi:predicted nuclease of predicted toxin-antitoxin system